MTLVQNSSTISSSNFCKFESTSWKPTYECHPSVVSAHYGVQVSTLTFTLTLKRECKHNHQVCLPSTGSQAQWSRTNMKPTHAKLTHRARTIKKHCGKSFAHETAISLVIWLLPLPHHHSPAATIEWSRV
uniref:(northern house mosquito) hypothetical protein n=1 Tax=Culex pipiens TaxID=7175 RepID=A0A8D8FHY3_CULPI